MDIKSTVASANVARVQTPAPKKSEEAQSSSQAQSSAVSVSVSGSNRQSGETEGISESVNDNLSREDAQALAGSIAEQLAALPGDGGIVSNSALLEEAARGV